MEELADATDKMREEYKLEKDSNLNYLNEEEKNRTRNEIYESRSK